jgi:hypothetical protein
LLIEQIARESETEIATLFSRDRGDRKEGKRVTSINRVMKKNIKIYPISRIQPIV